MTDESSGAQARSSKLALYIASGALVIALAAIGLFLVFQRLTAQSTANTGPAIVEGGDSSSSTRIDPPHELPDFTLTSQTGDPISLSDLKGRMVLLYFGYTHCPDFCPLTLEEFKNVQGLLGDQAKDVAFVFISVDGARDTPDKLASYLEARHVPDFIAMTGDEAALRRIGVDYGLYFEKRTDTGSAANYLIDHTSSAYLIDREGRLVMLYSFGTDPSVIADDIKSML